MPITIDSFLKRGYIPLACNRYAGIALEGEFLPEFWMWNGQCTRYKGGIKYIQTVKVSDLKEAALRYWRDGWIPIKPIEKSLLRRMEETLREHRGLMREGVKFPSKPFLEMPGPVPEEFFSPETREYLGLDASKKKRLRREGEPSKDVIESYKKTRGAL